MADIFLLGGGITFRTGSNILINLLISSMTTPKLRVKLHVTDLLLLDVFLSKVFLIAFNWLFNNVSHHNVSQ